MRNYFRLLNMWVHLITKERVPVVFISLAYSTYSSYYAIDVSRYVLQ